jgi:NAD(P)-dependent dehydrogenase (short-subunit alcohol dehydrogenase family)
MELAGKRCVVTGAASGIGAALCRRFAREDAARVVVADVDAAGAERVAAEIGGVAVTTDVSREDEIVRLVERAGEIDLFCSNAGIALAGGADASDDDWRKSFDVNFMAHVWAARALLPGMLARGSGYLMCTASAAGLLSQIGSAPYTASKHAAVAFAEWLSITYGARGIRVSCLCPQGVRTGMLNETTGPAFLLAGALEADAVAEHVVEGLRAERFLILPHPEVAEYVRRKAADPDRWLAGMRKLAAQVGSGWEKP